MVTLATGPLPSERRFGITFSLLLGAGGIYGLLQTWSLPSYGLCLLLSVAFGIASIAAPKRLAPLNRAWFRLGELLGRVVNPVVLGFIFFGLLTPIAVVARLIGRDELRIRRPAVASYWFARETSSPSADSFKHQF